jgi:hypothetical protein
MRWHGKKRNCQRTVCTERGAIRPPLSTHVGVVPFYKRLMPPIHSLVVVVTIDWDYDSVELHLCSFPNDRCGKMDRWNYINRAKPKNSEKNMSQYHCPPQLLLGLTWSRTRSYQMRNHRLTAWAMTRNFIPSYLLRRSLMGSITEIVVTDATGAGGTENYTHFCCVLL